MGDFGVNWRRLVNFTMAAAFLFGLALLASQHLRHIVGALPYVLLLACPLMHFFGHGHHHAHRTKSSTGEAGMGAATRDHNHVY